MATKLKDMHLTSVDLVRAGANQEADICLFKSADPQEAPGSPTEGETNILKRFIDWLRDNPAEAPGEPQEPVEKDYSTFNSINNVQQSRQKLWEYSDALNTSIRSIIDDNTLTEDQKLQMMNQSLQEFSAAMATLFVSLCKANGPTAPVIDTLAAKSASEHEEIDEIEEVEKANPYHAADGKFTSANGGGGGGAIAGTGGSANTGGKPAFASTKPKFNGNGIAKITVYRGTMGKDWTEEKLTINSGTKRTTKDSVSFEGMDKAGNSYNVKYRIGADGKADYSRCDVIEKSARYDEIEEIEKGNPYHAADGKFTSANGGGGGAAAAGGAGKINSKYFAPISPGHPGTKNLQAKTPKEHQAEMSRAFEMAEKDPQKRVRLDMGTHDVYIQRAANADTFNISARGKGPNNRDLPTPSGTKASNLGYEVMQLHNTIKPKTVTAHQQKGAGKNMFGGTKWVDE